MIQSINTDQKMLLGGAGGSLFMAVQIIVNRTLSSPEKKCVQRRAMRQKISVSVVIHEFLTVCFGDTYSGAGTLESGTSGKAVRLKWKQDV